MIPRETWLPNVPDNNRGVLAEEGLEAVCVSSVDGDHSRAAAEYRDWISARFHGEMHYLSRHAPLKFDPARMLPGARSVIVVGLNYYQPYGPRRGTRIAEAIGAPTEGSNGGRVARYAWGRDYHKVLGGRLLRVARELAGRYPSDSFRPFSDATPLAERYFAEKAGIAFTGRHTLLISSAFGSWFLVGEILTTLELPQSENPQGRHGACPTNCRRCLDVCPTGALVAPYRIDARRCISYLTIEYKGVIPEGLARRMGDWVFGCDLCQEVCPINIRAQVTSVGDFLRPIAGGDIDLTELLTLEDDDAVRARFAGSPLLRTKRRGLVRNALIAAANTTLANSVTGDSTATNAAAQSNAPAAGHMRRISQLCYDSDPVVRAQAAQSYARMNGQCC